MNEQIKVKHGVVKMKELTVFILVSLLMGHQNNVAENVSVVDKVNHPFQCSNFVLDALKKLDKKY